MRIVTLKHELKAQVQGKPRLQVLQDLPEQLVEMGMQEGLGDLWQEACLAPVVEYLRGGQHLKLPTWARPFLPVQI